MYVMISSVSNPSVWFIYDPTEFHTSLQYSTLHAIIIIINNVHNRQVNVTVAMVIRFRSAISLVRLYFSLSGQEKLSQQR